MSLTSSLKTEDLEKIEPVGCIIGPGYKNIQGYSITTYKGRSVGHHRLSYCLHNKIAMEDIKGKVVMHMCDNPPCINPMHLKLGTIAENNLDRTQKGRGAKALLAKRKLTQAQAEEIRRRHASKKHRYDTQNSTHGLAAEFGVTQYTIRLIITNKTYTAEPEKNARQIRNAEKRARRAADVIPITGTVMFQRDMRVIDLPFPIRAEWIKRKPVIKS